MNSIYKFSKEEIEHYQSQWYEVMNIIGCCDADNIREVFADRITNDDGEHIDVNYKGILVTFVIEKGVSDEYDRFGGRPHLSETFEVYNENGVFLGTMTTAD